jgi:hypothetical protein
LETRGSKETGGSRRDGSVIDSRDSIATIHGTRVSIIEIGQRAWLAPSIRARFFSVARVSIGAVRSRWRREVENALDGIAAIDRAGVAVVHNRWRPREALPSQIADFQAVAGVPVGAVHARRGCVGDLPRGRVATVHRARIPILQK